MPKINTLEVEVWGRCETLLKLNPGLKTPAHVIVRRAQNLFYIKTQNIIKIKKKKKS